MIEPAGLAVGALAGACLAMARLGHRAGRRAVVRRRLPERPEKARPWMPPPPGRLAPALVDADVQVEAETVWRAWLCALATAVAAGAAVGGPGLAALAAIAVTVAPLLALRARRGRADTAVESALPAALEAVARALRSGASLRQAVAEAAEVTPGSLGSELTAVAVEAGHGVPLVEALEGLASRRPLAGVRLTAAALCLGAETGGAEARAVDGVAATLRERLALASEVRALSAQTRASMLVIGLAPLGFCALASATDDRTSTFLFRTPLGLALLVAGLALDAAGALWMRRLCRVAPA